MFRPKNNSDAIELPHCLVTCNSLVDLRLCLFRNRLCLPNFVGFSSLRVLELNNVDLIDEDLVKSFFINCTLLEDLSLIDCLVNNLNGLCISCLELKSLKINNYKLTEYNYPDEYPENDGYDYSTADERRYRNEGLCGGSLHICCPKLVFLEYVGHIAHEFVFENLDSLKKAVIRYEYMHRTNKSFESVGDTLSKLLAGVSHVEYLSLNIYFVQMIAFIRGANGTFPTCFPNLKTLEITTSIEIYTMDVVLHILIRSPNLESLYLTFQVEYCAAKYLELDDTETRRMLTSPLKRVEFVDFIGSEAHIALARFLLEHGNALEEMVFSWCEKQRYHEMSMKAMKKVSSFHKASSTVKVIMLLKECSYARVV